MLLIFQHFAIFPYPDMKKINLFMVVQWIVFAPIIIPISIVTGAFEGLKKILYQAASDVFQTEEISS